MMLEAFLFPVSVGEHLREAAYIVGGYYFALFMTCEVAGTIARLRSEGFRFWSSNATFASDYALRRMRYPAAA